MTDSSKLLIIIGPSGAGKSTLMRELAATNARFQPVEVYTTRSSRSDDDEKITISDDKIEAMLKRGELLNINLLHGNKYGPSKQDIERKLAACLFPMIDWAPDLTDQLTAQFPGQTVIIFVEPPSAEVLKQRLTDRNQGDRIPEALDEYQTFLAGGYPNDLVVKSTEGDVAIAVQQIIQYLD